MIDLRNCKPGDKLISKHGLVLTYVRPLPEDDYMDHEVRYPDVAPYKGSLGSRTHEGYVMRRKRLEDDHDIVTIVSSEVVELDLKLLLTYIKEDDYEGMLKFLPEGIIHRASNYNTPEDFELAGYFEDDARYIYPAREKMKEACLDLCIQNIK